MRVEIIRRRIQEGDQFEFDGQVISVIPAVGRTNDVFFVVGVGGFLDGVDEEIDDLIDNAEGGGAALPEGAAAPASGLPNEVDDPDLSTSTAKVTTLADVLGMDADAPITDLKGIGDARAEDIPVETVGGLPADLDALNAFVGDAAFESLNRYYNDELFEYVMEEDDNE